MIYIQIDEILDINFIKVIKIFEKYKLDIYNYIFRLNVNLNNKLIINKNFLKKNTSKMVQNQ